MLVYRGDVTGHSGTPMTKIDTTSTPHSKLSEAVSSTNLSRSNPAHANPRRAFRRHAARTAVALATGATPLLCRAEAGELGGVGMVAIVALAAGWVLLTLFLFTMLRRVRPRTRYLASGLFLAAPFLWLAVTFGWFMMTEPRGLTPQGSATTRTAEAPVLMGGATFPAGSHVQYAPVDDHGEASQPSAISSDQPVALGKLSIRGIEHRDSDDDSTFDVALAYEQSIDGWPCAAVTDIGTRIDIGDAHAPAPHLIQCRLAKTVTIGDIAWPPATVVTRAADSRGWSLLWYRGTFSQVERAKGFSFDVDSMSADYDQAHALQSWQGTLAVDGDVGVGSVTFAGDPKPELHWNRLDGTVQVTGHRAGPASGVTACVAVASTKPRYRPCAVPGKPAKRPASS
ncbi:hypothetical protein LA03_20995 [Burkholderia gladioli]|nr:hypothetical protein LA03_20995 [Burkholderia gladioli]